MRRTMTASCGDKVTGGSQAAGCMLDLLPQLGPSAHHAATLSSTIDYLTDALATHALCRGAPRIGGAEPNGRVGGAKAEPNGRAASFQVQGADRPAAATRPPA